jgi:hypothetical protein
LIKKENDLKPTAICVFALLAVATVPAHAEVTINDETDVSWTEYVPCAVGGAGEVVDLSGRLHTLISFTINSNNVSGHFHSQPQGISGVGEVSGLQYHATGGTLDSFKITLKNGQASLTFVNSFRMIGQGPANNFSVHETLRMAIKADGTTAVTHDNYSLECR